MGILMICICEKSELYSCLTYENKKCDYSLDNKIRFFIVFYTWEADFFFFQNKLITVFKCHFPFVNQAISLSVLQSTSRPIWTKFRTKMPKALKNTETNGLQTSRWQSYTFNSRTISTSFAFNEVSRREWIKQFFAICHVWITHYIRFVYALVNNFVYLKISKSLDYYYQAMLSKWFQVTLPKRNNCIPKSVYNLTLFILYASRDGKAGQSTEN